MENKSLRGLVVCRNFLNDSVIKALLAVQEQGDKDRKSTRLNSSHA